MPKKINKYIYLSHINENLIHGSVQDIPMVRTMQYAQMITSLI